MKKGDVKISLDLGKPDLKVLDNVAKMMGLKRSALIRTVLFTKLDVDIFSWLVPEAKSKGFAPWKYISTLLRQYHKESLQVGIKK